MKFNNLFNQYILMAFLVFFSVQSCSIYNKTNSLEIASEKTAKTKLINQSGQKLKYNYIIKDNGEYYGVLKVRGETINFRIDEPEIETIKVKNKGLSTFLNILSVAVLAALAPAIAFAAGGGI